MNKFDTREVPLIACSLLMAIACYFSFSGLYVYLMKEGQNYYEGGHVIAYMALYSGILWVPFIYYYVWPKVLIRKGVKVIFGTPYLVMAIFVIFLLYKGGHF